MSGVRGLYTEIVNVDFPEGIFGNKPFNLLLAEANLFPKDVANQFNEGNFPACCFDLIEVECPMILSFKGETIRTDASIGRMAFELEMFPATARQLLAFLSVGYGVDRPIVALGQHNDGFYPVYVPSKESHHPSGSIVLEKFPDGWPSSYAFLLFEGVLNWPPKRVV